MDRRRDGMHEAATGEAVATAREVAGYGRATALTGFVSVIAMVFSAFSLYETVLKQADLHVYVPQTIAYTRDPNGSYEVFVIPITVANSGARDGVVSSLALEVRNKQSGVARTLNASFIAAPGYFSTKEDYAQGKSRPKAAFAPLSVPGRSAFTGTILFYPRDYSKERVVAAGGDFAFKLTATMDAVQDLGFVDRFWAAKIAPATFEANLPKVGRFFQGRMLSGQTVRLFVDQSRVAKR